MSTPLRILFTAPGYKPAYRVGGPIFSVAALAEVLVKKGHLVTVFTTNGNMAEDLDVPVDCPRNVESVEVWYFRREEWLKKVFPFIPYLAQSIGYLYAPAMARQLNITVPSMDVVHTHLPFIYPTVIAARAAQRFRKPLFYHQRGVLCPDHLAHRSFKKNIYIHWVERPIIRQAAGLIALTEYERDSYRQLGVSVPCYVIPNGINLDQYDTQYSPEVDVELGLAPDATVVLFMARLHPMKGVERLLDAFFKIQRTFPKAVLVIAGPDEYGLLAQWKARVRVAGYEQKVIFPGNVSGRIKRDLFARADLFCLPSDAEGFSMSVLEAMASGTAVMISPGCHFPEVEKAGAGKVVAADSEAMAKAMAELLKDKNQLKEMGLKGREFVTRNYTWDVVADHLVDAYREGIERHSFTRGT